MSNYLKPEGAKKRTLIVNLIGGPGTGKTTTMALVFGKLKSLHVDSEMVSEFAKELTWEHRNDTMKDEIYIFAKQAHRLFRVNGQVDVIVTDRPLMLSVLYNHKYGTGSENFDDLIMEEFDRYDNFNIFLKRVKPYNPNGRNQDEQEANEIAEGLKKICEDKVIPHITMPADEESADKIVELVLEELKRRNDEKDA